MLKLKVRTSTCLDFHEFNKIVTGPKNSIDTMTAEDAKKFVGFAQCTSLGNELGVFVNPDNNAVVISMVRRFLDGGEQKSAFYVSKESAGIIYNLLGKAVKGKKHD